MIYSLVSSKGGSGKTSICFNVLTAILKQFTLIEIDNNNNTSKIYLNSAVLKTNSVKSVKINDAEAVFDQAMFEALNGASEDIIIDSGGGDDTLHVIKLLLEYTNIDDCIFIIPFLPSRAQIQNALDTYKLVQGRKVIFVLNGADKKEDFVFWFGSTEYDVPSVSPDLLRVPTFFLPKTPLFDLSALSGEVLIDASQMAAMYDDNTQAQKDISKIANGNFKEYRRIIGRYRISVQSKKYITDNFQHLENILKTI
jgi:MinD-like ATPase involved in chromosome partitioning or flagellar assembly